MKFLSEEATIKLTRLAILITANFLIGGVGLAQTVPAKTGSKIPQAEAKQALDFHNKARKEVGTPPLAWSPELAKYAQDWADRVAAGSCSVEHRPNSGEWKQLHGENLSMATDDGYTALAASQEWYSEKKDYKNGKFTLRDAVAAGHYTQMVWKDTTRIGIGIAKCKGGEILIVANYDPSGNHIGQTAY